MKKEADSDLRDCFVGGSLADLLPRLADGFSSFASCLAQLLAQFLALLQDLCLLQLLHRLNKEQVNAAEETVTNQYGKSTIMLQCLNKEPVNAAEETVINQYNKSTISPLSDQRTSQCC